MSKYGMRLMVVAKLRSLFSTASLEFSRYRLLTLITSLMSGGWISIFFPLIFELHKALSLLKNFLVRSFQGLNRLFFYGHTWLISRCLISLLS